MSDKLNPPPTVREIAERLERAGFEAWCVGGAVRDALLGESHLDWDLATSARPEDVRRIFRRTVPVGIEFGTVGVLDRDGVMHEVTTFRRDVETDGRHARVIFGASLEEDLSRRDFTINAIAYSPSRNELFDPFDGQKDLGRGVVRAVGDAHQRFEEDRLRALRALRFAARFSFRIEDATWSAVRDTAPHLQRLSAERIRQEMLKTMEQVERPSAAFRLWRDSGALARLVPPLAEVSDTEITFADYIRKPRRADDARRTNRIIALLAPARANSLERLLRDLRFSNAEVAWMHVQVRKVQELAEPVERAASDPGGAHVAELRRLVSRTGRTRTGPLLRVLAAIWCARSAAGVAAPTSDAARRLYARMLRIAYRDPVERADLALDGDDLRQLGAAPGPVMGVVLDALLERVLNDPQLNTRADLIPLARDELARHGVGEERGKQGETA